MNEVPRLFTAPIGPAAIILIYVLLLRLFEIIYANRNTSRLIAEGGKEYGQNHFHWFLFLHGSWLLVMAVFADPYRPMNGFLLLLFAASQIFRFWTLASIGPYWTVRIISAPHFPIVKRGPYRFMRHPNYWLVALEITLVPLLLGMPWVAFIYAMLNAALLRLRIGVEDAVLRERTGTV